MSTNDQDILRALDARFGTSGPPRFVPLKMASPAPPEFKKPGPAFMFQSLDEGRRRGRPRSAAGRPTEISPTECEDEKPHHWVSAGKVQARCIQCHRKILKALIEDQTIHIHRQNKGAFEIENPESIRPCISRDRQHAWMRDGMVEGRKRAQCRLCKARARRIEI